MMLNPAPQMLHRLGLTETLSCLDPVIIVANVTFLREIIDSLEANQASLPTAPGFEIHPYKGLLHSSVHDKYIVGTFPPISYIIDELNARGIPISQLSQPTAPHQKIDKPEIPFFHGNVNGLWKVLLPPAQYDQIIRSRMTTRAEKRTLLINWLEENGIYYDDIIRAVQRKLMPLKPANNLGYSYEDKGLMNICPDSLLLARIICNETLKVICFTNGATFHTQGLNLFAGGPRAGKVNIGKGDAFSLFLRTWQELGVRIELRCLPHFDWTPLQELSIAQRSRKLIFECRLSTTDGFAHDELPRFFEKKFTVLTAFSPAAHGKIEQHPVISAYRRIHGNESLDTILRHWFTCFRESNWQELYQYNIQ